MEDTIKSVCRVETEDGLEFLTDTVRGERIRGKEAYTGVRENAPFDALLHHTKDVYKPA